MGNEKRTGVLLKMNVKKKLTAKCEVQCWRFSFLGSWCYRTSIWSLGSTVRRSKHACLIVCCPLILSCPRDWLHCTTPSILKASWIPIFGQDKPSKWMNVVLWDPSLSQNRSLRQVRVLSCPRCWPVQPFLSPFLQTEPSMAYECHNQPSTLSAHKPKPCK